MKNKEMLDLNAIKKYSKKLHKEISLYQSDFKLSQAQEIFSKLIGFNNYHSLQKNILSQSLLTIKNIDDFIDVVKLILKKGFSENINSNLINITESGNIYSYSEKDEVMISDLKVKFEDIDNFILSILNFDEYMVFKSLNATWKTFNIPDIEDLELKLFISIVDDNIVPIMSEKVISFSVTTKKAAYNSHKEYQRGLINKNEYVTLLKNEIDISDLNEKKWYLLMAYLDYSIYEKLIITKEEILLYYANEVTEKIKFEDIFKDKDFKYNQKNILDFIEKEFKFDYKSMEEKEIKELYYKSKNLPNKIKIIINYSDHEYKVSIENLKIIIPEITDEIINKIDLKTLFNRESGVIFLNNDSDIIFFEYLQKYLINNNKNCVSLLKNNIKVFNNKVNGKFFNLSEDFKNYNIFLESVKKYKPDVIIIDDIDNYETLSLINKLNKKDIKIFILNPSKENYWKTNNIQNIIINNKIFANYVALK